MCNECVAEQVLKETRESRRGYCVLDWEGTTARVDVRAERTAHRSNSWAGRYQVRRPGEEWPAKWTESKDLAGSMGAWGFDVKWEYMTDDVRAYLEGRGPKPDPEAPA
jgi:hypothetical protein